ncbi:MAG: glycoside hydrolase [Planctomycetaceae bacterium]|jgi:hypothetical protein|nr:glycoside hydrolase [Planctomycetaceae bacterium]
MKTNTFIIFALILSVVTPVVAYDWVLTDGKVWSRQNGAITLSNDQKLFNVVHTGKDDWALSEGNRITVKAGDVFQLEAKMKVEGDGDAAISVVTRKKNGDVVAWTYGTKSIRENGEWVSLHSKFMIPPDVATIEPRVVGNGNATVFVETFSLTKTKTRDIAIKDEKTVTLDNKFLNVTFNTSSGTFSVTDKRTKRIWLPSPFAARNFVVVPKQAANEAVNSFRFGLVNTESLLEYNVTVTLESESPELIVRLDGNGSMPTNIEYPPAFASKIGDRLIVPVNEGIGYPVDIQGDIRLGRLIAYGGHGICMAFWGQVDDANGAGSIAILETPDDASINFTRNSENLLQVNTVWEPSRGEFRYQRSVRFVFFNNGGHVTVCKRYREYAKQIGLLVPFTDKVMKNPNIDLLLGAANIWYWENNKVELVKEMKELGIDRILWSGGGSAEQLTELNKIENVLTSRYDIYQDVMNPAHFDKVWVHGDWTTAAWDKDINWTNTNGEWRKGWYVDQKDKTQPRIPCAVICDAKAVKYARERISNELKTKPFTARFIDTTVAAPWFECYHPDHPMTRSDSRQHKMELLGLIGELGLVCGSETGHDASVPFCDFFEGMLSLGQYRVNESGRNMLQVIDEVPTQIERFQVNAALRLPLWELVYHDCTVAMWYWGDYNNKLPRVWRKRDLFNALYGTPPMYMFTSANWKENKQKFAESYKTAAATARATAYAEMTEHNILSPDRLVQQTVFANGVKVTVNFGEEPFKLVDGTVLKGNDWKMEK